MFLQLRCSVKKMFSSSWSFSSPNVVYIYILIVLYVCTYVSFFDSFFAVKNSFDKKKRVSVHTFRREG